MASGYEMKAKPAPLFTTFETSSTPSSCAKCPKMPKMQQPASSDVKVSNVVTMFASRYTLCPNLLYEEYMMMLPKHTESEKKTWVMAAYQTFGSKILSHWGVRKYLIPLREPGSVSARTRRMLSTKYGKIARTYEALPELLTPFTRMRKTIDHEMARKTTNVQLGVPMPSSMLSFAFKMSFLKGFWTPSICSQLASFQLNLQEVKLGRRFRFIAPCHVCIVMSRGRDARSPLRLAVAPRQNRVERVGKVIQSQGHERRVVSCNDCDRNHLANANASHGWNTVEDFDASARWKLTQNHLHEVHRLAHQKEHDDVWDDKGSAAVFWNLNLIKLSWRKNCWDYLARWKETAKCFRVQRTWRCTKAETRFLCPSCPFPSS